ncbi:Uncharacterised protein [Corynebacterium kutscheri]|uniref:Uncharacterized protein n=1 Tax=Corynebacterium kutscheri TaxID=35755 RepID=A0A0F6TDV2_9CORY|nr:hypothetical protein [Corynebacterium kutscheri]AKE41551.1 hypothetical protein UL82_06930 [Corynebacterium kutscheri]VEH08830.1 Uncharacterised protein [Corynebacterium kutscheri]VEH09875.1 Uncharacterised protein [Corynebacterium kutscheri]VEH79959.1 Uncharacterised protein [Corynebacterium kutscheri]
MLIAALCLAALGFVFLVLAVTSTHDIWQWLLLISVFAGAVILVIDVIDKYCLRRPDAKETKGEVLESEVSESVINNSSEVEN